MLIKRLSCKQKIDKTRISFKSVQYLVIVYDILFYIFKEIDGITARRIKIGNDTQEFTKIYGYSKEKCS